MYVRSPVCFIRAAIEEVRHKHDSQIMWRCMARILPTALHESMALYMWLHQSFIEVYVIDTIYV